MTMIYSLYMVSQPMKPIVVGASRSYCTRHQYGMRFAIRAITNFGVMIFSPSDFDALEFYNPTSRGILGMISI